MARFPAILKCGFASGTTRYDDRYPGQEHFARIVIYISVEAVANVQAVVDTGAPWCVLDPDIANLGKKADLEEDALPMELGIRGQIYKGKLIRADIILDSDEGGEIQLETSVFVPKLEEGHKWPHPNFIGLGNFLDRICFAIDPYPGENTFYFGFV